MNISITIPEDAVPAWQFRVDKYNAGSGKPPVNIEQFCQLMRDEDTVSYIGSKAEADKASMAANTRLMALGAAVMVQPDKLEAVEAAVKPILNL